MDLWRTTFKPAQTQTESSLNYTFSLIYKIRQEQLSQHISCNNDAVAYLLILYYLCSSIPSLPRPKIVSKVFFKLKWFSIMKCSFNTVMDIVTGTVPCWGSQLSSGLTEWCDYMLLYSFSSFDGVTVFLISTQDKFDLTSWLVVWHITQALQGKKYQHSMRPSSVKVCHFWMA